MLRYLLLYPFRLVGSAFYWAQFRVGGNTRARMTSIEIDNRVLWEKIFALEARLANVERWDIKAAWAGINDLCVHIEKIEKHLGLD